MYGVGWPRLAWPGETENGCIGKMEIHRYGIVSFFEKCKLWFLASRIVLAGASYWVAAWAVCTL